jgi:hypothetical protein
MFLFVNKRDERHMSCVRQAGAGDTQRPRTLRLSLCPLKIVAERSLSKVRLTPDLGNISDSE